MGSGQLGSIGVFRWKHLLSQKGNVCYTRLRPIGLRRTVMAQVWPHPVFFRTLGPSRTEIDFGREGRSLRKGD